MSRYPPLALASAAPELPLLTRDVPGVGGAIRVAPEDFEVEEIPAYHPAGEGSHVLAWIEKRDRTTIDAVRELARAIGVHERDVGSAGLKDRRAVTRQYLSFPSPASPEALLAAEVPGVRVLSAARHGNKLKTGHLRGNRFRIVVRGVGQAEEAAARAATVLERLARAPGAPNWYGEQRFGAGGDNAATGRALVRGERVSVRGPRERRLLISAFQSELFNRYLERRIADRLYDRVVPGELLRVASGGMFESSDPAEEQRRLDAGEVVPTGPIFGHEMRRPAPGSEAARREEAILAEEELAPEDFRRVGKLAPGTRRAIAVPLEGRAVRAVEPDAIEVAFSLPAGAYATVILRELMKDAGDSQHRG